MIISESLVLITLWTSVNSAEESVVSRPLQKLVAVVDESPGARGAHCRATGEVQDYSLQFCCHSRGVRLSQMSSMKSSKDGPAAGAGINAARKGSKEADSGDVGGPGKPSAPASTSTGRPQPQFKPTAAAPPEPGATPQEPTLAEKVHGCLVDPGGLEAGRQAICWRARSRLYRHF